METAPYDGLEVVHGDTGIEVQSPGVYEKVYLPSKSGKAPSSKHRICGLSRAIFSLALALTVLALVVIGLGVGLGVALSKTQGANTIASNNGAVATTASSTSVSSSSLSSITQTTSRTSSSTATSTPTSTTSTITSTSAPHPSNICPDANNTIATVSLGSVRYLVACDSDFSGSGKETLSSFVTATWDDCLSLCNTMNYFQNRADVGCTWNVLGTGTQTPGTCWCLGGAGKTVVNNVGNIVGVPQ